MVWWLLLSVFLSGCVYIDIGSDPSRVNLNEATASRIIPGQTTREEVLTMLGPPDEASGNGKQITYVQKYAVALLSPGRLASGEPLQPANRYILVVEFDERGIVSRRDFIAPSELHDQPPRGAHPSTYPPSFR
jgi:hypothetical protein